VSAIQSKGIERKLSGVRQHRLDLGLERLCVERLDDVPFEGRTITPIRVHHKAMLRK
jgi:hypothetical protein